MIPKETLPPTDILRQKVTGRGIKGDPVGELGGARWVDFQAPSAFKGPRIEPAVYDALINEGAHTYVAQELQPYLNIWLKNNPGKKVVNFHVGEPSEIPLDSYFSEGIKVYTQRKKEDFGYQSTKGREDVAEVWAGHINRWKIYADPVQPEELIFGASGKTYAIMLGSVLRRDGMNATVFTPMYPGHAAAAMEATSVNKEPGKHGIYGIPVTEKNHWMPDPNETAEILDTTKPGFIIICNPQNPTGGVLTKETAKPFVDHVKENPETVIFEDLVYHPIVFNEKMVTLAGYKEIQANVVGMDSLSKDSAVTGARVSALVIRNEIKQVRDAVLAKMNHLISSGPTPESVIAKGALSVEGDREIVKRVDLYKKKKDTVVEAFNEVGLDSNNPGGAFYLMVRVPDGVTASKFAKLAAQYAGVTFLPAKNFGSWKNADGSYKIKNPKGEPLYPEETAERYIRVAYVGDINDMGDGIRRLAPLIQQLGGQAAAAAA
ncbi:pyridoxal phosphate-dependent aminotransferase [Patescibacteria group bacterium]|nr:pyridoxal phosphate-dependent aminotransferase [Patescibacteria group bacterium]MBU4016789.1 pyridoxal phosphate-dependent aminotransferase [Patescibacteria group bacterium]MBU4099328.1 pyridoxal phosphate-dependent aminotransferase [Patescibacteria group bacterium]